MNGKGELDALKHVRQLNTANNAFVNVYNPDPSRRDEPVGERGMHPHCNAYGDVGTVVVSLSGDEVQVGEA